jgi:hypothetical protein
VGQNDHHIQQPKRGGRHDEHVDHSDAGGLIAEKAAPGWRRRPSSSHHVLGNRGLADLDAEFEQFTVDPGRTPERVGALISRISLRISESIDGRPVLERQRQNRRKP